MKLLEFLQNSGYISNDQYGFIPGSDTSTTATDVIHNLQEALNDGDLVGSIFIDVAKAFNTVNHGLLLEKLKKAGVEGPTFNLLSSYLSNRQCTIRIGTTQSEPKIMTVGVPQGSRLSTTLFLLFRMTYLT